MKDALAVTAGGLGTLIAVIHGYLGEMKVVRPIKDAPASAKRVLHAIMFLSAVYWFIGGAILVASPLLSAADRRLALSIVGAMYLSGAAGNLWATRGRHFGWLLLSVTAALAWLAI